MNVDASTLLIDGPWRHQFVPANGARFHVAIAGPDDNDAPLVVLLHGMPEFWWAWRHQLPALAAAGYRVAAMDLRGTGASDKPPHGYDVPTLARDVAGLVRSLGADRAVVVGPAARTALGGIDRSGLPDLEHVVVTSAEPSDGCVALDDLLDAEPSPLVDRGDDELAVLMFTIEGLPQKQVAEALECSVEAVKWHVFQARKKLKELLKDVM